jgi:myo-inositol 2-dehydrogenase / D-chiro-inositol 1-dehydrogenase
VSDPPRVAAVGVGVHAVSAILPSLAPAGLRLAATCARHAATAHDVARRFGDVPAFDNLDAMLDEVAPGGVVVVVPPDQFYGVIRTCIDRRVPVFTEKPAANDHAEAEELADAAREAGVPVVVGYMKRFASGYRRAKEICSSPGFGELTLGSFTWSMGPFAHRFDLRDWLFENAVHHFDLARFFFGELREVQVARAPGVEHTVVVTARSSSGAVVSIRANTTGSWEQRNEAIEIYGTGSSVLVENLDTCIHRPPERPELVWRPNYTVPAPANMTGTTMGFVAELAHFRDVIVDGVKPESDMASAAATLALTSAIAEQALQSA